MPEQTSVSIVIPMFNEKEGIESTVNTLSSFLNSLYLDYEIIVVDDGSTDGSSRLMDELCKIYPFLRTIHFYKNRRIGEALKAGFNSARKSTILYTDSDLPVDICNLKEALDLFNKDRIDMVIGYRVGKRESILRVLYTSIYNLIIKQLFKVNLRDINCSMKVFRKKIIEDIELKSNGPFLDAELMIRARNRGFKIFELKISSIPRKFGYSKFASSKKIIETIFKISVELMKFYPELTQSRLK